MTGPRIRVEGPPGLRRSMAIVAGIGFAGGVLFAMATGLGRHGDAAPVILTRVQAAQVIAAHRQVITRFPHRSDGLWQCAWLAQMDAWAFARVGVPADALRIEDVATPRGWPTPRHRLLRLDAVVDGRPWRPIFDMNSAWPLDDRRRTAVEYRSAE